MPTYTIRDSQTGRSLKVSGANPPSEADAAELFAANPGRSLRGFAGNVAKSGGRAVTDVATGLVNILNPDMEKNTVANLARLPFDAGRALAGDTKDNKVTQIIDYYKNRYGKDLGDTLYEDPVGVALDISTFLTGGGGAIAAAGKVGKFGSIAKAGNTISKVGRAIDPLSAPFRAAGKATSKLPKNLFKKIGTKLETQSNTLLTKGIGNPVKQVETASKYGLTMPEYIKKYNVYDRSPETAGAVTDSIMKDYSSRAMNSNNKLSTAPVIKSIDDEIAKLTQGVDQYSDVNVAKAQELLRRKEQLLAGFGSVNNATPIVGVDEMTRFRQMLDNDIPQSQFGLDAVGTGKAQGAKQVRNYLRKAINSTDPELERLGLDIGASKSYQKILDKSASRADNRQAFNFTKLGGAGIGGIAGGALGAVGGFLAEQAVNNPKFLELASKTLDKGGKSISNGKIPKPSNLFKNITSGAYNVGKYGRPVSLDQTEAIEPNKKILPEIQSKIPLPIVSQAFVPKVQIAKQSPVAFGKVKRLKRTNAV